MLPTSQLRLRMTVIIAGRDTVLLLLFLTHDMDCAQSITAQRLVIRDVRVRRDRWGQLTDCLANDQTLAIEARKALTCFSSGAKSPFLFCLSFNHSLRFWHPLNIMKRRCRTSYLQSLPHTFCLDYDCLSLLCPGNLYVLTFDTVFLLITGSTIYAQHEFSYCPPELRHATEG